MKDIVVYTVILGGWDNLRPPRILEPGVRYVCVTDEPLSCQPWEIRPAWTPYADGSRNSRIPKILAHLHFDSEYSIYHDGHLTLRAAPSYLVDENLRDADLALFRHPCRDSVYREARQCETEHIGDGPAMTAQIERYRRMGLGRGLWAGGMIIRRHTEAVAKFNEIWWSEFLQGCMRDQLALPAAIHHTCIKVHTIDADIMMDVSRVAMNMHAAWENFGDNADYVEARNKRAEQVRRLKELCPPL